MTLEQPPGDTKIEIAISPDVGDVAIQFPRQSFRVRAIVLVVIGATLLFIATMDIDGFQGWQTDHQTNVKLWVLAGISLISGLLLLCIVERIYLVADVFEQAALIGKLEVHSTQIGAKSITDIRKHLDYSLERSGMRRFAAWFNATVVNRPMIQIEYVVDDRRKLLTLSVFRSVAERDWMYECLWQWRDNQQ
jgi:hypothetical protein